MSINFGCFSIDVVGSISRLCNCIAPHKDYVCSLKEIIDALTTAKTGLIALKNVVKRQVETDEVQLQLKQDWLKKVEDMEAEVDQLIRDSSQEIEKNCLGGCCPKNCLSTYKQGKKVAEKIIQVTNLKGEGNFPVVAGKQLLPSGSMVERPSRPTVGLDSAFNKAQSYIGDEGVGIIGIYGMGGVGKTTLLTQINNNLCANFDLVIWVVVSKNSSPVKVQDGIGKKLGFHDDTWKNNNQDEKATLIFGVLKRKRFVLLLDDIWEQIDLVDVGVPIPNEHNKSKVIFTTRSENVCGRMESQKKIKVGCLVPEKAWDLFQDKVGEATLNAHPKIPELAKILANECKGLPLALITIGRAMACKTTLEEWHYGLEVLKENAAKFSGMEDQVLSILKLSYDSLQSDMYRSCFLYCSLFPEDYSIPKERLIEYWIGEGLLDGVNDLNKGYDIIGTLIHACLLEEDDSVMDPYIISDMSGRVKMHDVIRDLALWIACKCDEGKDNFLVQAGNSLKKLPEIGKRNGVERMSLMHNQIEELEERPVCPNLLTLFLNNNQLKMITRGFFQNMPNLKVLDLSDNFNLEMLPVEISELVSLQYLNLSSTNIRELPIEYKNLEDLKYLNLEYTYQLDIIPQELISSFKS